MSIAPGTRLGPYEILEPLGAGAMGEVYRARDPRLQRSVAIKVLPEAFARDPDRLRRFETEPGRQFQCDWGEIVTEIAGQETKVHFLVTTLGYSRRFHFWSTDSEDAEHTFEGIIRFFEYLGGIPAEGLFDNLKVAVFEHRPGQKPRFQERFLDLARHYGFTPRACQPGRARTKGKDERNVGYVKGNFFQRYRSFESWAHLNQLAEQWLREEADPRIHGTVKEVVAERFERERPMLRSLPATRYDTAYREIRQVSWDAYVDVRGNRYSVPDTLTGRTVTVRVTLDSELAVYHGDALVVSHRLRPAREGWVASVCSARDSLV